MKLYILTPFNTKQFSCNAFKIILYRIVHYIYLLSTQANIRLLSQMNNLFYSYFLNAQWVKNILSTHSTANLYYKEKQKG